MLHPAQDPTALHKALSNYTEEIGINKPPLPWSPAGLSMQSTVYNGLGLNLESLEL